MEFRRRSRDGSAWALHPVGPGIKSLHVKDSSLTFLSFLTMLFCARVPHSTQAWGIINNTLIINEISTANV